MPGIQGFWEMVKSGGFAMWPLLVCSLVAWAVIIERLWRYRSLRTGLREFHMEAVNTLLTRSPDNLRSLVSRHPDLPTARLMQVALERMHAKDERLRQKWMEALERRRQMINQELRQYLWILGTIASAAPFIGLFGTVVGILRSFNDMAKTGAGGFNVVAAGISESLIATATGIVVAVVAVLAYNAFQTRWSQLVLTIKLQTEELAEMLNVTHGGQGSHGT
jgi:biopolymer transport protein ExbB